jgi:hypothetical protein
MITCYLQGGLGNQLFILFTTIAYALQNNQSVMFYYSEKYVHGYTLRYTYWNTFFKTLKELTTIKPIMNGLKTIKEHREGKYTELDKVNSTDQSAILYGYFQSFKYFQDEYGEISRMLGIADMRNRYFNWFSKNDLDPETTISMHFCFSDCKKHNNVLPIEYYSKSLDYMIDHQDPLTVLYFCEEENRSEVNQIINTLQQTRSIKFKYCNITSSLNSESANSQPTQNAIAGQPEDEMIIMSICKYNIIANSTFSWWAAYIGDREDDNTHIVCYSEVENTDLYPEKWYRILI